MNHYTDKHTGKKYTQQQIDRNYTKSAKELQEKQRQDNPDGCFNYCEFSGVNDRTDRLDCAHVISRKECKELGEIELIWDKRNLVILARRVHEIYDGLAINQNKISRFYIDRFMNERRLKIVI